MAESSSQPLSVKSWMGEEYEPMLKELRILYMLVETATNPVDESSYFRVVMDVMNFMASLFDRLTSYTRLIWYNGFGHSYGKEDALEIRKEYPYLLECTYVLDDPTGYIMLVAQMHAVEALNSIKDLEQAELLLEKTMKRWKSSSYPDGDDPDEDDAFSDGILHGVIFVGGRMALYRMDKDDKFWRLIDGRTESTVSASDPRNWRPVINDEVLQALLQVIEEGCCRVDPDGLERYEPKPVRVLNNRERLSALRVMDLCNIL